MLNVVHDKKEDIPETFQELYTERDGKWHLTGVAGVKTELDVTRLNDSLKKERDDHKATKEKLHVWDGMDHAEITTKLDRMAELEVAAGNKEEMDSKLEELTEARIKSRLAPVERENVGLKKKLDELQVIADKLQAEKVKRVIDDQVGAACVAAKVLPEAQADVKMLAGVVFEVQEDGTTLTVDNPFGVTPGFSPELFIQEMQEKRPHWWPRSVGGDSPGSGPGGNVSENPWTYENWNLTKQGEIVRTKGMDRAKQLAKLAGTVVGGSRPKPRDKK